MNTYEKLLKVQGKLKAPKGQHNEFGNFNYRSCEDIVEAVKPICKEFGAVITLSDEITSVNDWIFVKATARFDSIEEAEHIESTAYARIPDSKKGMDVSQLTGAASSYARKYALNGLLMIDDTRDADTMNNSEAPAKPLKQEAPKQQDNIKHVDPAAVVQCDNCHQNIVDYKGKTAKELEIFSYVNYRHKLCGRCMVKINDGRLKVEDIGKDGNS